MIIDRKYIENGITNSVITTLIDRHERETTGHLNMLRRYYLGDHKVKGRQTTEGRPNNKVVNNYCKYIVDMSTGFFFGSPIMYTAHEGADISPLISAYQCQEINETDMTVFKNMCMYGRAYELIYNDENGDPKSVALPPQSTFCVYDDTAARNKLFGVHYRPLKDLNDLTVGFTANVYTESEVITYVGGSVKTLEEKSREINKIGLCPIIEYINNEDRQGDYEQLIDNIDAYNVLQSDRVNDKEQFVDAFLFLKCLELDTNQAQELKREKILISLDGAGDAKYLAKALNETDTEVLKQSLNEDIHKFSMVPDLTDESFSGNSSGVAIQYKLLGFENMITNKETFFFRGLRERLSVYTHFLVDKTRQMKAIDVHEIEIVTTRNLPQDDEKKADMVTKLRGVVSDTTLRSTLSFVKDEESEVKRLNAQEKQETEKEVDETERLMLGAGYKFSD